MSAIRKHKLRFFLKEERTRRNHFAFLTFQFVGFLMRKYADFWSNFTGSMSGIDHLPCRVYLICFHTYLCHFFTDLLLISQRHIEFVSTGPSHEFFYTTWTPKLKITHIKMKGERILRLLNWSFGLAWPLEWETRKILLRWGEASCVTVGGTWSQSGLTIVNHFPKLTLLVPSTLALLVPKTQWISKMLQFDR